MEQAYATWGETPFSSSRAAALRRWLWGNSTAPPAPTEESSAPAPCATATASVWAAQVRSDDALLPPLRRPLLEEDDPPRSLECRPCVPLAASHAIAFVAGALLLHIATIGIRAGSTASCPATQSTVQPPNLVAGALQFPPAPPVPKYASVRGGKVDVAYVAFIRHGERSQAAA